MSRHLPCAIGLLALLAARAPSALAQEPAPAGGVIAIESRTLTFAPSRDDLTVGTVWFNVYCSRPAEVRINGVTPTDAWHHLALTEVAKNRFALPDVTIELSPGHAGLVCLSVKAWFDEVGNEYDALFYVNPDDRYALVSFATRVDGPDWEQARPRFSQNRVATLRELEDALARPFSILLNQRPLTDVPRPR